MSLLTLPKSLELLLCLNGLLVSRENCYHEATREAAWEAGIPRNQLDIHVLVLLSVARDVVKSSSDCPLLSYDWYLMRDLQQELNKSKTWIPDLPEHGTCETMMAAEVTVTCGHLLHAIMQDSTQTVSFHFCSWTQVAHFDGCQFNCKISSLSKYLIVHTNF